MSIQLHRRSITGPEIQDAVTLAADLQQEHFVARINAHIDVTALLRALDAGLDPDMLINDQLESLKASLHISMRWVMTEAKALALHLDRLEQAEGSGE